MARHQEPRRRGRSLVAGMRETKNLWAKGPDTGLGESLLAVEAGSRRKVPEVGRTRNYVVVRCDVHRRRWRFVPPTTH